MLRKEVYLTNNGNEGNLSRQALLNWVNSLMKVDYKKVESLGSGEAYCMMLELLYPKSVGLKKVKKGANQEYQFIWNLKLFQEGLVRINCTHQVPIDRLAKCKFQDNLEFLQWFHKFYEAQWAKKNEMAAASGDKPNELDTSKVALTFQDKAEGNQNEMSAERFNLKNDMKKLKKDTEVAQEAGDFVRNENNNIDTGEPDVLGASHDALTAGDEQQNDLAERFIGLNIDNQIINKESKTADQDKPTSRAKAEADELTSRFVALTNEKKELQKETDYVQVSRNFYLSKVNKIEELLNTSNDPLAKTFMEAMAKHDKKAPEHLKN